MVVDPVDWAVIGRLGREPLWRLTYGEDASLDEATDLMGKSQVRRLIVVDESGACCGILSQADVAQHAAKRETAKMVAEVSEPVGVR